MMLVFSLTKERAMKVVLLGNMVASCQAFNLLVPELQKRGADVVTYLANGKYYPMNLAHMLAHVRTSDVAILGTASSPDLAKEELAAAETAIACGVPFAFYADTYGTWNRQWFREATKSAAALFVINEDEAQRARAEFPNVNVVASGNPVWEGFAFPSVSRQEVRAKIGIADNEKLILCPFGKSFVVNILHAGGVIDVLSQSSEISSCQVILAHHPGDKNPPEAYADLTISEDVLVRVVAKQEMTTSNILVGSDLVVESASTLGIEAAHQRTPVISYFSEIALAHLERQTGSREWEPCKLGVSYLVQPGRRSLYGLIALLLGKDSYLRDELSKQQEAVYPVPKEKGTAVRKMADALESIAKK